MLDREITPSEAIIVLDRLNTEERIEVDRDELRAAIKVAKAAMLKQVPRGVKKEFAFFCECPVCERMFADSTRQYCYNCGQKLDWSKI